MDKPEFSLENWQRQRINEYIFLRSEQAAFDEISKNAKTDADLVIAALGVATVIEDDASAIVTHFEHELAIPRPWLSACLTYMEACLKNGGYLKPDQLGS